MTHNRSLIPVLILMLFAFLGCSRDQTENKLNLITLDPGHFHAALVQKSTYPTVDSTVYVYAPKGVELERHLALIKQYNERDDAPTNWSQVVFPGADFFEKMLEEQKGDVVVLAGNNRNKTNYIGQSITAGLNVLSDKPMAIDYDGFLALEAAFEEAQRKKVLLYDIMTERFEITNRLQKALLHHGDLFGDLETGSEEDPAIIKESVHHFYKQVSGQPLIRPAWYFDVDQQGDGIVDVTTHMVDLIQWTSFPETIIDYKDDVEVVAAKRWPTIMDATQFEQVTGLTELPDYLQKDLVEAGKLAVYANGEIDYKLKGIHAKILVKWNFQAPDGAGDTHYSIMRGTKANLSIRQGEEQGFKPVLYIEAPDNSAAENFESRVQSAVEAVSADFPGITVSKDSERGFRVNIPVSLVSGHEEHFAQVANNYFGFLTDGGLPDWEVPNMLAKYYVTTKALEIAKSIPTQ